MNIISTNWVSKALECFQFTLIELKCPLKIHRTSVNKQIETHCSHNNNLAPHIHTLFMSLITFYSFHISTFYLLGLWQLNAHVSINTFIHSTHICVHFNSLWVNYYVLFMKMDMQTDKGSKNNKLVRVAGFAIKQTWFWCCKHSRWIYQFFFLYSVKLIFRVT